MYVSCVECFFKQLCGCARNFPIMDDTALEQGGERPGACVQCVERCQREHRAAGGGGGAQFVSSVRHPSFLRTVLEHNVRQNMAIPKSFVQMHAKSLPGSTVDLEGANGKIWLVTVVISSTGTAVFRVGWHVFAEDNNLKLGDAVLFTMVAKNRFTVRVFSKNGLETLNPTNAISHDSTQTPNVGASHLAVSGNGFTRSGGSKNGREPRFRCGRDGTIQEIIKNARDYDTGEDSVRRRGSGKPRRPKRHRRSPDAQQGKHVEVPGANSTLYASRRRIVTNEERKRAQEESRKIVATLARPSVEVVMMPSHVYRGFWLSIPHEFSKLHLPLKRMHITLRDAQGEDWEAQYIGDVDHNGFSGGWAAFSKDHCLEEGDVCVFELVDSKCFIFHVHICRVVQVPCFPTRRGPAGWEVTYNIIKPDPPLPDLNDLIKSEPDDDDDATPTVKRSHLAGLLQEMIQSGKFSNLRREEYDSLPSKIRALAENSMNDVDEDVKPDPDATPAPTVKPSHLADTLQEMIRSGEFSNLRREEYDSLPSKIRALVENSMNDVNEDVKPDVKGSSNQFKRPNNTPFNLSSDFSIVKVEREDVHSGAPNCRPRGVEVRAEPMYIVKTEDVSTTGELSPVAVYSRRRRKDGSNSAANSMSTEGDDERVWYPVIRMLSKRQREGQAEKEFLVEVMGTVPENERSSRVEQGPDGFWWVPSSQFSSDCSGCFFR